MLINLEKCEFGVDKLTYLGFEMDKTGYRPDPRKMESIKNMKMPETLKGIRGLLGFSGFYRHLIPRFSQLVRPLTYLTTKAAKYTGGPMPKEAIEVFKKLQDIFTSRPFLAFPDFSLDFHLYVDASLGSVDDPKSGGLAGCLVQFENNDISKPPKPIGFCSRSLQSFEKNYTVSMIETLGICFSISYFEKYLRKKFYVHSDHRPLSCCKTIHKRTISRFREILANYDFEIIYEKGETMVADFPSRHAVESEVSKEIAMVTSSQLHQELESFEAEKVQLKNLQTGSSKIAKVQVANSAEIVSDRQANRGQKNSYQDVWISEQTQHAVDGHESATPVDFTMQAGDIAAQSKQGECTIVADVVEPAGTPGSNSDSVSLLTQSKQGECTIVADVVEPAGTPGRNSDSVGLLKNSYSANQMDSVEGAPEMQKGEGLKKNALQVAALKAIGEFNLGLQYKPELDRKLLIGQQSSDPFIQQLKIFIQHKILPKARYRNIIKRFGPNAFIKNGLVMIRIDREGYLTKDLLVLPACRHAEMIAMAHSGKLIGGHSKVDKTANRLLEFLWWPGLWSDVQFFIDECNICKRTKSK